jgi:YidC/Oxa1 family membrane protein insertase
MDKRLWLAMVLSFLLIFLYQSWVVKKKMSFPQQPQNSPVSAVENEAPPEAIQQKTEKQREMELPLQNHTQKPKDITIEHPLYTAIFTTEDASLKSFKLKKYRTDLKDDSPLVELVHNSNSNNPLSTIIECDFPLPEHIVYDVDKDFLNVDGDSTLTFSFEVRDGFRIEKQFKFLKDSYLIELNVKFINMQEKPIEEKFSILWNYVQQKENNSRYHQAGPVILLKDSVKREVLKEGQDREFRGDIDWFGIDMHYFLSAIVPENKEGLWVHVKLKDMTYSVTGNYQPIVIPSRGNIEYKFRLFVGPKEISFLDKAGYKLAQAINLGWFHAIGYPLLILLKWLYGLLPNYGVAIIILTILVRVVFFPLSITSYRSMKKMQVIQPEMKELQKKYANDREKLSRETWELYRRHKVNPLGGCLPMLIQIPVFIALYQALMNAIELRHAPFMLWMNDLSAPDLLFTIPLLGHPFPFRVLPVLMGLTMFVQQKMTPMAGDPQQVKIMMWMPALLTVMLYGLPSGLTLYWTVSNLLSIVQQWYINRKVKV